MLVLVFFRIVLLISNPVNAIVGFGDLGNFFRISQIPGWPYLHFWSEYPPIFPFFSKVIFVLANGREDVFVYCLFLLLTILDVINLKLFLKLSEKVDNESPSWLRLGAYLIILTALPYSWWYFEPLVVTTILAGLLWILKGKYLRAGVMVGLGILVKLFPVLLLPLILKKAGWKKGLLATAIALGMVVGVYGALWITSPDFTLASLQSQGMKGSWESIWAVVDGNTMTGKMGPLVDRLDPLKASQTNRNPALISPILTLLFFGGVGLWVFVRSKLIHAGQTIAFGLITFGLFFLWSPGWSVQWVLYLLPLILLVFPLRTGSLLAVMLMIANLLEWPVIYQLNQNFVPMTIILRMILLLLTTWMAYQIIFYRSAGGISYTSGLRSEKTGK